LALRSRGRQPEVPAPIGVWKRLGRYFRSAAAIRRRQPTSLRRGLRRRRHDVTSGLRGRRSFETGTARTNATRRHPRHVGRTAASSSRSTGHPVGVRARSRPEVPRRGVMRGDATTRESVVRRPGRRRLRRHVPQLVAQVSVRAGVGASTLPIGSLHRQSRRRRLPSPRSVATSSTAQDRFIGFGDRGLPERQLDRSATRDLARRPASVSGARVPVLLFRQRVRHDVSGRRSASGGRHD